MYLVITAVSLKHHFFLLNKTYQSRRCNQHSTTNEPWNFRLSRSNNRPVWCKCIAEFIKFRFSGVNFSISWPVKETFDTSCWIAHGLVYYVTPVWWENGNYGQRVNFIGFHTSCSPVRGKFGMNEWTSGVLSHATVHLGQCNVLPLPLCGIGNSLKIQPLSVCHRCINNSLLSSVISLTYLLIVVTCNIMWN